VNATRRGLSLVELMAASVVMTLLAGGIAVLAIAVQTSSDFHHGRSESLQHGRVAIERIQRAINQATANESFPGMLVMIDVVYGEVLPDTLVVWLPRGNAADAEGLPRISELVTFCTQASAPGTLLEIRVPDDHRTVPPLTDTGAWHSEVAAIKASPAAERIVLTDLLRVVQPPDDLDIDARGAIRFEVIQRPSEAQWSQYQAGLLPWDHLSWVQGIYGQRGLRQTWCRFELQLRPADVADHSRSAAIPLFGSGAVYYDVARS
jgi:hypothetical protein